MHFTSSKDGNRYKVKKQYYKINKFTRYSLRSKSEINLKLQETGYLVNFMTKFSFGNFMDISELAL